MNYKEIVATHSRRTGQKPSSEFSNNALFDGHLRIYPTMACNLHCHYCVNKQMGCRPARHRTSSPQAWIAAIRREKRHIVLTGGEPFLYQGLIELLNGVPHELKVRVYSNFSLDIRKPLAEIKRPVHFYISWHPQQTDRDLFLANIKAMRENELFTSDIHGIATPETCQFLERDIAYFNDNDVHIEEDADQRTFLGSCAVWRKWAACSKNIYLIGPDGTRFQCVSRMVRNDRPMENILHSSLGSEKTVSLCPDFGNCAPCDILGQTRMTVFENDIKPNTP